MVEYCWQGCGCKNFAAAVDADSRNAFVAGSFEQLDFDGWFDGVVAEKIG